MRPTRLVRSIVSLLALFRCASYATAQQSCSLSQVTITTQGDLGAPMVSLDGAEAIFSGDNDLPSSSGHHDVYIADLNDGSLTNLTAAPLNDGAAVFTPDLVVFMSQGDLTGNNPDGNYELFGYDRSTASFSQLTVTPFARGNGPPQLARNGSEVLYVTDNDPATGSFIPQSYVILDTVTLAGDVVTLGGAPLRLAGSFGVAPTGDFSRLYISSDGNFTGANADHNNEIFELNRPSGSIRQLTHTLAGQNLLPSVSLDGGLLAFQSSSPELTIAARPTVLMQMPSGTLIQPGDLEGGRPVLSPNGQRVITRTSADVRVMDLRTNEIRTLMSAPSFAIVDVGMPDYRGERIAIRARLDPLGLNPEQNFELFLATCRGSGIVEVPTMSIATELLMALALLAAAVSVLRRTV